MERPLEMGQLEKHLMPTAQNARRKAVVLIGPVGTGKTRLCIEFARKHHLQFSSIIWLDGSSELLLKQSIAAVACRIPGWQLRQSRRTGSEDSMSDVETLVRDVLHWLSAPENNRWLIVFDDVDVIGAKRDHTPCPHATKQINCGHYLECYLPVGDHGSIIMTTQQVRFASIGIPFMINAFDYEQALALFKIQYRSDFRGKASQIVLESK